MILQILSCYLTVDTGGVASERRDHHVQRCEIPEDTFLGSKLSRQHGDNIIDAVSCGNLFGLNIIKDIRVNVHFPLYKGIKVAFPDKDELANIICQQNLLVIKPAESQRKKSIISHKITVW